MNPINPMWISTYIDKLRHICNELNIDYIVSASDGTDKDTKPVKLGIDIIHL